MGVTAEQIGRSLTEATSSSRFIAPSFFADPKSGIGYQVQVEVPQQRMNSIEEVKNVPVGRSGEGQVQLRNVAEVSEGTVLGEYDRYNMQRMLTLGANVYGEDLGRVADRVTAALKKVGAPPQGVSVAVRGQVVPMEQMFTGLQQGLLIAVAVIFLLLAANFQSLRLSLAVMLTIPAVVAGVAVALLVTRTTLNIQSFMGAIMCVGVSVSNSVMLVTFISREWAEGKVSFDAARAGAQDRLRPILMTACAMTIGMVPMALALERGSEMQAPLGRAVIGGLVVSTFATLFIIPSVFALLMGRSNARSPSLHPDDPASSHYDPIAKPE
jgi:multidrug efflux pump subunit AcrB